MVEAMRARGEATVPTMVAAERATNPFLLDLLDRLDQASLAAQRRITIPFLRELLRAGADAAR